MRSQSAAQRVEQYAALCFQGCSWRLRMGGLGEGRNLLV